jgi:hypothetical protein
MKIFIIACSFFDRMSGHQALQTQNTFPPCEIFKTVQHRGH